jgi:hypothetical protein
MQLDEPGAAEWVARAPLEDRIVCYADKRATQRVVTLEMRFARWRRKHPEYGDRLDHTFEVARHLEADLCRIIGIRPDEVERLSWVEDAMARAHSNGRLGVAARNGPSAELGAAGHAADRPAADRPAADRLAASRDPSVPV